MSARTVLSYVWKAVLGGLAFMAGTILGSMLAGLVGLQAPSIPEGTDPQTLLLVQLLISPLLAVALGFLSRRLRGGFVVRWLILSLLTWLAYSVNTLLEAAIFTTMATASPFTAVIQFVGSFACGAVVATLFRPEEGDRPFAAGLRTFFHARPWSRWAWRLAVAAVLFMPIYLFFGRMVVPFTYEYYREGLVGLTAPGWDRILPVLFIRSVLFLVASLPVLVAWRDSRRSLILALGFAMFVLVGALGLLGGYWLPLSVRVFHGLEILADSMVYAWLLVMLLVSRP
jgi:hypothetical protein